MTKKISLLLLSLAAAIVLFLLISMAKPKKETKPTHHIAVIVYGENDASWRSIEQGIGQACTELNIERPVLRLAPVDDIQKQKDLIQQELANGANGLLVAPNDSEEISDYLRALDVPIPVVVLESGAATLQSIAPDDSEMSRLLAEDCINRNYRIALISSNMRLRSNQMRQESFLETMEKKNRDVFIIDSDIDNLENQLVSFLTEQGQQFDILVALDSQSLLAALSARPISMVDIKISGIGRGLDVITALDRSQIETLMCWDDYAIGYLATKQMGQQMGLRSPINGQNDIEFRLVTRDIMYDTPLEQMLFPINQ